MSDGHDIIIHGVHDCWMREVKRWKKKKKKEIFQGPQLQADPDNIILDFAF